MKDMFNLKSRKDMEKKMSLIVLKKGYSTFCIACESSKVGKVLRERNHLNADSVDVRELRYFKGYVPNAVLIKLHYEDDFGVQGDWYVACAKDELYDAIKANSGTSVLYLNVEDLYEE